MRSVQQLFDLHGKTALVTGGSRGLGLQIAEALGEQGAKIVLSSRKQSDLDEAVMHLKRLSIEASAIAADLSQEAAISPLVEETLKRLGQIDILINNAGATWGAAAEDYAIDAWDKVMNLNVRSLFLFAQAVAKASMIPNRSGRIINVASIAGLGGNPAGMNTLAYNTSKGAVINFGSLNGHVGVSPEVVYGCAKAAIIHYTRCLALDEALKPRGAKVCSLAPGVIDTDMQVQLRSADDALFPDRKGFAGLHQGGQLTSPDEAAGRVLAYLARADFGQNPVADVRD